MDAFGNSLEPKRGRFCSWRMRRPAHADRSFSSLPHRLIRLHFATPLTEFALYMDQRPRGERSLSHEQYVVTGSRDQAAQARGFAKTWSEATQTAASGLNLRQQPIDSEQHVWFARSVSTPQNPVDMNQELSTMEGYAAPLSKCVRHSTAPQKFGPEKTSCLVVFL